MHLELRAVSKGFGQGNSYQQVLDGVDLDIERGERVAIIGSSGSGKSTLLHAIGGLMSIDSGSIRLGNLEISSLSSRKLIEYRRAKLGFVFQFYNLIPNLSVRENIEACHVLSRNPLDIDALIEDVGLTKHKNKIPSELSGGQQQRCSLARAIVKNPELLLCDEPTGALDSESSKSVLELIEKLNEKYHTTVILVTHNIELTKFCDRIIEIKDGRIIRNEKNLNPLKVEAMSL
ncbi:MAG: ABC transporter ATP-binding protein [Eubacteriales bacterium]|nr:ABC transporter ATP-binding protein [Eubacteriales bacterium]